MGAKLAKPSPPADNAAKAEADLALQGMDKAMENFLNTIRLGEASAQSLGYPLTDQRLTKQESHLIVQTTANAPKDELKKAVDAIFGGDWKAVTGIVVESLASFFGGDAPTPVDSAVNDEFSKSFLVFEYYNVVQYSIYIKRTNAKSTGTVLQSSMATMMSVICKGNVDYAKVDGQTVLGAVLESNPNMEQTDREKLLADILKALRMVADLAILKRKLEAGALPVESLFTKPDTAQLTSAAATEAMTPGTEAMTPEEAQYDANHHGLRVFVANQLNQNVLFNGSLIRASMTSEVTINQAQGANALTIGDQKYVEKTLIEMALKATLVLSYADDTKSAVRLKIGDQIALQCRL